jgi:hypothetical protein
MGYTDQLGIDYHTISKVTFTPPNPMANHQGEEAVILLKDGNIHPIINDQDLRNFKATWEAYRTVSGDVSKTQSEQYKTALLVLKTNKKKPEPVCTP